MSSNCFENVINSFKIICSTLEKRAELNLKQIEKECEEEFASSVKSLDRFNQLVIGIGETCSEVVNNNDILKLATKKCTNENVITLPYEIHSDVVNCIRELYNMPRLVTTSSDEKLINEKNQQLVADLVKIGEKNVRNVKDIENTIIEAKEIL